jgi:hypothetical protein
MVDFVRWLKPTAIGTQNYNHCIICNTNWRRFFSLFDLRIQFIVSIAVGFRGCVKTFWVNNFGKYLKNRHQIFCKYHVK